MQKMLLLSSGLEAIERFIPSESAKMRMLFIPTAGNPYDSIWWIDKDRQVLEEMGFRIRDLDIAGQPANKLNEAIENTDIVYIAGGNTFYLLQQLRLTGFDSLLTTFIRNGGLYAGASAGAIIVGPEIEPARQFDDPERLVALDSTAGLGLVDFVPFPHYDMGQRTPLIDEIIRQTRDTYTVVPITDDQAIIVNGNEYEVVDSKRTAEELDWPTD